MDVNDRSHSNDTRAGRGCEPGGKRGRAWLCLAREIFSAKETLWRVWFQQVSVRNVVQCHMNPDVTSTASFVLRIQQTFFEFDLRKGRHFVGWGTDDWRGRRLWEWREVRGGENLSQSAAVGEERAENR
jgi:hypothetical protein